MAAWIRSERSVRSRPVDHDPALNAHWAIFVQYRRVLRQLRAEDPDGLAVWASKNLLREPPLELSSVDHFVFLTPVLDSPARWRVLQFAQESDRAVTLTLNYDAAPALSELYHEAAAVRARLLDWGFEEAVFAPEPHRPEGLCGIESELFRTDAHRRPLLDDAKGLKVLGAPQGEGIGLVLAREIQRRLELDAEPEDILVLVRRWDDEASLLLETLQSWGLPAAAERREPLAAAPAVAALRLAMSIPVENWETATLIQWLRHGQVQPSWLKQPDPLALARAASALRATRVFRGLEPLRGALDRVIGANPSKSSSRAPVLNSDSERARGAREVLDRLAEVLVPIDQSRPWREQTGALRWLAQSLGIGASGDPSLEAFWEALDDQEAILDRLGRGDRNWSWTDFLREVESLTGEVMGPPSPFPPGSIRLAEVDAALGARSPWVILANLGEGTFPIREAVDTAAPRATEGDPENDSVNLPFVREMHRFVRLIGSAEKGVVLAYPTSDPQGQELLKAGFLEDVLGLFAPTALADPEISRAYPRFDPTLSDWPELAGAATDARVRALALACLQRDFHDLRRLAEQPRHRRFLEGTAAALRVAEGRLQSSRFGEFDGRLDDPRAIHQIVRQFGPEYTFSPSQLESFLFCPFQFFLRYVLKLLPVDERDELEEDYTERGSRVHRVLEVLERRLAQEAGNRLEQAEAVILNEMNNESSRGSDIELAVNEIEQRRLVRTIRRYVRQHEAYETTTTTGTPVPHLFEVAFGFEERDPQSFASLELGAGDKRVRLQGKIDRIDLVAGGDASLYRIIDYKTGACPSKTDVKEAIYLQLPLYALAVERIVLQKTTALLHDVGYWALAGDGFKPIALKQWESDRQALEEYVSGVVGQLRQGLFIVDSCKDDCVHRCEYGSICRIRQVRAARKVRESGPHLELKV